jgi:hypothetical protein
LVQAGALPKTRIPEKNRRCVLEYAIVNSKSVDICEVLYDQGFRLGGKEVYPTWVECFVIGKRNNFKKAYTTLYGIMRRRVVAGKDMTKMISSILSTMRFDMKWLN